jgi:hypothetical protein
VAYGTPHRQSEIEAGHVPATIRGGGELHGDRKQPTYRWTARIVEPPKDRRRWPIPVRVRRTAENGFVVFPTAFAEGRLSREAWREVKRSLSPLHAPHPTTRIQIAAVSFSHMQWSGTGIGTDLPMSTTWVELWRTIHRVYQSAVRAHAPADGQAIGITIQSMPQE